jgi:ABC-type sugar transport system substrate-binding protein
MAGFVPQGARVAVLTGPSGDANSRARIEGFERASTGHFQVVASAAADWDTGKARSAAAHLLQGDEKLKGIFAANDLMALGAVAAVDAAGREGAVAVVGVDGIREALQNVKTGKLSATVAQYPYTMGQLGIEACVAAAHGKTLPSHVDAPLQVVTKRNVARVQQSFPKPLAHFNDPLSALLSK